MSSVKKKILLNSTYLLLSDVGFRLLSALATIFLARYLGPSDFGLYIVAYSLSLIFNYLTDLGLSHTYIREFTRDDNESGFLVGSFLKWKLVLAAAATFAALILIPVLYQHESLRIVAYLIVIPSIWGALFISFGVAYFSALQKMKYVAVIRSTMSLTHAAFLFLCITFEASLFTLSLSPGFSALAAGIVSFLLVSSRVANFRGWNINRLFSGILMFAALGLITMALPHIGPLILQKTTSVNEVGIFSALYRVPLILAIVPISITAAYYPQLFKYAHNDIENHMSLSLKGFRTIPILVVGLALPFVFYSDLVVSIILGEAWEESSYLLTILAWLVVIQAASRPLASYLITLGLQTRQVAVLSVAMISGILSYIYLGTHFGALGGVWSAVIIEVLILTGYLICCSCTAELIKQGLSVSVRILFCLTVPLLIKLVLPHEFQIVGVIIAPISFYLALTYLSREFRQDVQWVLKRKNWSL